jgi:hypothetical protein
MEYLLIDFGHTLNTAMGPLGEWGEELWAWHRIPHSRADKPDT